MSDAFGHEQPGEGKSNDWITPKSIIDKLWPFDLDPCESDTQPWPCGIKGYRLGRGEDGLKLPWEGAVYCNPPYGPYVGRWAQRMREHGNGILLIYARFDTDQWQEVWKGDAFLFIHGRLRFYLPDGRRPPSGTAPSALIAYGEQCVARLRGCNISGAFFEKPRIIQGTKGSQL